VSVRCFRDILNFVYVVLKVEEILSLKWVDELHQESKHMLPSTYIHSVIGRKVGERIVKANCMQFKVVFFACLVKHFNDTRWEVENTTSIRPRALRENYDRSIVAHMCLA